MKKGQKLLIIGVNKGTTAASEGVNSLLNNDLPKAIYSLEYAVFKLEIAVAELKKIQQNKYEGG